MEAVRILKRVAQRLQMIQIPVLRLALRRSLEDLKHPLIAAPARVNGETMGTVGVIGSKRMHYENTMNAVSYVAQVFDRINDSGDPRST